MPRCRWQEEGRCFVVQRSIFSRRRRSPQKISGTANVHSISQLYLTGIARAITRWFKWGKGSQQRNLFCLPRQERFFCVLLKKRCLCDIIFKKVVKLLKNICYVCYETGCITEKEIYDIAQFVTVKKYNVLYAEELPRFRKQPLKIYALPYDDQPDKTYNGTGRMGLDLGDKQRKKLTDLQKHLSKKFLDDFNFADELMQTESTALQFVSLSADETTGNRQNKTVIYILIRRLEMR